MLLAGQDSNTAKKFQLLTWKYIYHFKTFFFSSWLLLYAPHCFWAGLSGYKENVNELFKGQEKSQPMLDYVYFHRTYFLKVKILRSHATRKRAVLKFEVWWIEMLHFLTWIYYFIFPLSNSLGFERIHSDFFWTQFESLLLKFVSRITEKVQLIGMGQAL